MQTAPHGGGRERISFAAHIHDTHVSVGNSALYASIGAAPIGAGARLIVSAPDTARTRTYEFDQPIPPAANVARYTGRTVMLIDERTISQAEHTGLFSKPPTAQCSSARQPWAQTAT